MLLGVWGQLAQRLPLGWGTAAVATFFREAAGAVGVAAADTGHQMEEETIYLLTQAGWHSTLKGILQDFRVLHHPS